MSKYEVVLIDFEDSFTFNIATHIFNMGCSLLTINHQQFYREADDLISKGRVFIFGPGPGHPSEYTQASEVITKIMSFGESRMIFGVCLGHQLLGQELGKIVEQSVFPRHGVSEPLIIPSWPHLFRENTQGSRVDVQYYSSLCLIGEARNQEKVLVNGHGEIIISSYLHHLSYQFHPESIGTSCRDVFFDPIASFLYNR
jgi:anthranilate/para-aminobenzoate synthase component II